MRRLLCFALTTLLAVSCGDDSSTSTNDAAGSGTAGSSGAVASAGSSGQSATGGQGQAGNEPGGGAGGGEGPGGAGAGGEGGGAGGPGVVPVRDEKGMATELTCPGSPGCATAEGKLMAGVAKRAITGEFETYQDTDGDGEFDAKEPFDDKNGNGKFDAAWLAGFSPGRAAMGVHDDAWARVLTFTQGETSYAMVSLDLIGLFQQYVLRIRERARERGLDFDHVMVSTTHVHETRDTMGMWGEAPAVPGVQDDYMEFVVEQVVDALAEAKAGEREATLRYARAEAPQLVNDTRKPNVIDQSIHGFQLIDTTGQPFATGVVWGNHPEALGSDNTQLTSDYVHYLREKLESRYQGSTAVFFNGCLGGLTTTIRIKGCPDAEGNETCAQGTFERAAYVGEGAANAAIEALDGASSMAFDAPSLAVRRRTSLWRASNNGLALLVVLGVLPREIHDQGGRLLTKEEAKGLRINDLTQGDYRIATEVNALELGPLVIATVPGELYGELWLEKGDGESFAEAPEGRDYADAVPEKSLSAMLPAGRIKMVINNANDAVGYIIPRSQWDAKAPYTYDDQPYGEENSLGHNTAPTLIETFGRLYNEAP